MKKRNSFSQETSNKTTHTKEKENMKGGERPFVLGSSKTHAPTHGHTTNTFKKG